MPNDDSSLYFVTFGDEDGDFLLRAFEIAESRELNVTKIHAKDLMEAGAREKMTVFVTDRFEGEVFELLLAENKRVFGPICILECIESDSPLPNALHPVYSMSMTDLIVATTSIAKSLRKKLQILIEYMNGVFAAEFTIEVTHLVAGEVNSKKYATAARLKKPIVLPSWIEDSWKESQVQMNFNATHSSFQESHYCPIFKGCSICVSGFETKKRNEIKRLVEMNGGSYLPELSCDKSTHLLIEKPVGNKFHFAQRWSVICVEPCWLYECITAGHWLDEAPFKVKPDKQSKLSDAGDETLRTSHVDASINHTMSSEEMSKKARDIAKKSAEKAGHAMLGNSAQESSSQKRKAVIGHRYHKLLHSVKRKSICNYNVPIPSDTMFLDGCQLYLVGFNDAQLEYLQKIINAGGATRFNKINDNVTHIVVGDEPLQDVLKLVNDEFAPHVVKVDWLLESCRQSKCLSEEEYYCMESNDNVEENQKTKKKKNCDSKQRRVSENDVTRNDEDILKQYLTDPGNTNQSMSYVNRSSIMHCQEGDEIQKECSKLLKGFRFRINGFDGKQLNEICKCIEDLGGCVLPISSMSIVDYLIVPLTYECLQGTYAKTVVTYCWLQSTITCGEMLDPDSDFLFTPFALPENVYPLENCVISVSQFYDLEKNNLSDLIETLGGQFQEFFSRKAKENVHANTHLILKQPLGAKYDAAVKWGIPPLTVDWLYECARSGRKVDETPYLVTVGTPSETVEPRESTRDEIAKDTEDNVGQVKDKGEELFNEFAAPRSDVRSGENRVEINGNNERTNTAKEKAPRLKALFKKAPSCKPRRPSYDLTEVMDCLQSPCPSSGSSSSNSRASRGSRSSFLMDDYIQEHLQAGLKNSGCLIESRKESTMDNEGSHVGVEGCVVDSEGSRAAHKDASIVPGGGVIGDGNVSSIDEGRSITSGPLDPYKSKSRRLAVERDRANVKDGEQIGIERERSDVNDGEQIGIERERSGVNDGEQIGFRRKKSDAKDGEKVRIQPSNPLFLSNVVLVASKKCGKRMSELRTLAISVGAQFRESLDKTCTHYICEGRLSREQSKAKSSGVHVVSPHWLYDCVDGQVHLDEVLYPSSYNPKLSLSVVKTKGMVRNSKNMDAETTKVIDQKAKSSLPVPPISQENVTVNEATAHVPALVSQDSAETDSLQTREELKQIQDLMQSMKATRRRSGRLQTSGNSSHSRNSSESNEKNGRHRRSSTRLRSLRSSKSFQDEEDDAEQSMTGGITYDDPKSRQERQKIIAQLEECSPSVSSSLSNITKTTHETPVKKESLSPSSPIHSSTPAAPPPIALHITTKSSLPEPVSLLDPADDVRTEEKPRPRFTLSSMTQQEKIDYCAMIENLGGVVFETQYFNSASRHTVTGQLNRNEKCLSSIAAGNWLLRKSYLEECREAQCFVDEEPHEWGVALPGQSVTLWGLTSRYWRVELAKKSAECRKKIGAFQDWKVLLCVEEERAGSFSRMLEAGGAKVLGTTPPFQNIETVTHAFINPGATHVNKIEYGRLEAAGISVLRTEYIIDYLTAHDTPLDTSKYLYHPQLSSSKKRKQATTTSETHGKRKKPN